LIGDQISHYRIIERLGSGGMGEVFKAEDTRLDRLVALKFLPPELGRDSAAKARFIQEAKAASALDHDNVCTIFDIGETEEGRLFLAMALYEGESLHERLAEGPLPIDEALGVAEQVARGLIEAHGRGITHRDIKPANLMITRSGIVKIVDFGLAKLAEDPGLTATGVLVGTPAYMSPEQARAEKTDHRTDLWSLGVVLYEMLTGRRPFVGLSNANVFRAILQDEPEPVGSLRGELAPEVERLVDKFLARHSDARCATAKEALELLTSAREQQTLVPELPTQTLVASEIDAQPAPPGRKGLRWILVAAGVVVAGAAIWRLSMVGEPGSGEDEARTAVSRAASSATDDALSASTVAVLPFANLSPSEENAYFADGIHEDILIHLSRIKGLTVLARTSVIRYKETEKSVAEIASELGADVVLQGSVRRARDQIRIGVQLIDAETEGHLWADSFDRRLDDVFAVQTEIARSVAASLETTLSPAQEGRLAARPPDSLAAYDLYLRGREAHYDAREDENTEAIRLFREAIEIDPRYSLAWAGLAQSFAQRALLFGDRETWSDSAVQAAHKAIEIDSEIAEGHTALGYALEAAGRPEAALEAFARAVELAPDHWPALSRAGRTHFLIGRFDEAIRLLRRAARQAPTELEPRWYLAHAYKFLVLDAEARRWNDSVLVLEPDHVGAKLLEPQLAIYRGETEMALAAMERLVGEAPDEQYAWVGAGAMAYMARDFERAAEWGARAIELAPESDAWYWHDPRIVRGYALLRLDETEAGVELLEEAAERHESIADLRGQEDPTSPWNLATISAALGDGDAALSYLERAYDLGFRFVRWLPIDPAFDDLRDDPRYEEIMTRMDNHVTAMRERVIEEERASRTR